MRRLYTRNYCLKYDQPKCPEDTLTPTSKSPDALQISQSHDLRMLDARTPRRRDIRWIIGPRNDIFENIQNGVVRPIADAMDVLCAVKWGVVDDGAARLPLGIRLRRTRGPACPEHSWNCA